MSNLRVEIKNDPYMTEEQRFKSMFHEFNIKVQKQGIKNLYKEHSYFESKARKKRRLKRETEAKRAKELKLLRRMVRTNS